MRKAIVVTAIVLGVAGPCYGTLGSVVYSFDARINVQGKWVMPVGMECIGQSIFEGFSEGYIAERKNPTGEVLHVSEMLPLPPNYRCGGLAYDGEYLWTTYSPVTFGNHPHLAKIDRDTLKPVATYVISMAYPVHSLAWADGTFIISFVEDKYKAHEMATTGSIISTFDLASIYLSGVEYVDDQPTGPVVMEGLWVAPYRDVDVWTWPGKTFLYRFTVMSNEPMWVGDWDGRYMWTYDNSSATGGEHCYAVIAFHGTAVTPASWGQLKAVFK